jgi:hypothetical protein
VPPSSLAETASLDLAGVRARIAVPFAALGDSEGRWEAGGAEGKAWLDVVLLEGAEREIDWEGMDRAAVGIAVRLSTGDSPPPAVDVRAEEGVLRLASGALEIAAPLEPGRAGDLQKAARWAGGGAAGPVPPESRR